MLLEILMALMLICLAFYGYHKDRSIVSPLFIMPAIWGLFLFFYNILPHNLYPLQQQFLLSLIIWITTFLFAGYLINAPKFSVGNILPDFSLYNKTIFNIYFLIVIVFAPLALMLLIQEALKVGIELFFLKLRMINTGLDEDDTFSLGILTYIFTFTNIVLLLFTYYKNKVSNFKYYIVLFLQILLGLITLARTNLIVLILSIFIILYFKNLLKRKHYIIGISLSLLFIFLMTFLREFHETEENENTGFLVYLFAGMPAYDSIVYKINEQFGSYTFRFFYAVTNALGAKNTVEKTILPYAYIPKLTNVYTVMFPFFKDFGYKGITFFGFLYGLVFNFIYKYCVNNQAIAIILYSVFFPMLVLQFFGEYFFSNFSTYLQFLILLLIPKFIKIP